jgi:hypothetical protein
MYPELKYKEMGYTLTALGIANLEGKEAYKIEVTDKKGEKETQYFDVTTGYKVKSESVQKSPAGDMQVSAEYSDYKEVGKVKYPHTIVFSQNGQGMPAKVTAIEQNKGIADDEFTIK